MSAALAELDRLAERFDERIEAHETLDQTRFGALHDRLGKIEKIIFWAAAGLISGQAGVIATLLWRLPAGHP